ncbi:hypothetical protein ACTQZK_10830 [Paraeggerthella sp. LCP19S3_G8]|uniref:hypothetical protein n=1 Tax=Paraeggerthella sp. LCP19S3_G8 TaxID=3440248 RepID=UPI002A8EE3E4|nr:transporter [Paraeggerthella sp.]
MQFVLSLVPLAVIIVLLVMKKHMLFAGLVGGVAAMIIGGISFGDLGGAMTKGLGTMFGNVAPILYAAAAAMAGKGGCFKSLVNLCEKLLKGKFAVLAAVLVVVQACATYMAGLSAGNTMVIAPLVFAAIGAVPEVVAGMAIAGAVCFITSPAGAQGVVTAENIGIDVVEFANIMTPFTIVLVLLAAALAFYGVYRRGTMVADRAAKASEGVVEESVSNAKLFVQSIPVIVLLLMVVLGGWVNGLVGSHVIVPAVTVCVVCILIVMCTPLDIEGTCNALIDGSQFILTTMFSVGIFLGFINLMEQIGAFSNIASIASAVPTFIMLPVAMIIGFLIAIPSGAYCAGVLTLILPTMALMGFSPIAMGLIALATGLGTQISPVQINVVALSNGFDKSIMDIVKNNMKYMVGMLVLLIAVSFFFA